MKSLHTASTGMMAQQLNVEVISNNIANMRTTGYKRQRAEFQDLLYQNLRRGGSSSSANGSTVPSGIQVGAGVKTGATYRIMTQGGLSPTDKALDVAIRGEGFFQVEMPNGQTAYTRDGTFERDSEGNMVTLDGYKLVPNIIIPENARDISISVDGMVEAFLDDDTAVTNMGQITLSRFANKAGLEAIGDNLLLETPSSGAANTVIATNEGAGSLLQKYIEQSNVNAVQEISDLIAAQRAYEMNSKVITVSDEMMSITARLK
ncbi:MAG: flagellar basal-body rod protein FlgG [OCS116 cluster bacterium]|uniref:Flagellar basal-body rod protein FlgG n=1 Tax=OCS116 cluster bacterium TaxID=2030921 RepID=A0A2A4Z2I2_9PROT|nr:flagellar basal-body rod protein FlgG [OCS116 cluster bacterium]